MVATSRAARPAWWYFVEDPDLCLPRLDIKTQVSESPDGYEVEISANAFVKDLVLNADRLDPDATVDELFVTLLPGETTTVSVCTRKSLDADALTHHPVLNSVNGLLAPSRVNRLGSP
jgi:beta-mannosidase